jgi:hypothetical protein
MLVGIIIGLFIAWTLTTIALLVSSTQSDVPDIVGTGVIGLSIVLTGKVRDKFQLWRVNHKYCEILFWIKGEKRYRCRQLIPKKDLKKFNTDITKEYFVTLDARPQELLPNRCDFLYEECSGWTREDIQKYYRKDDED